MLVRYNCFMIVILNGPINAGKTTIAQLLCRKIPNTAHVEVDKVREFIDWMEGSEGWIISFETAIEIAKKFVEKGLNVIFTYHISKEDYEEIVKNLHPHDQHIYAFTLKPAKKVLLQNRGNREMSRREINRINELYDREMYRSYGEIIDNTNQKPDETADIIYEKIRLDLG